MFPGGSILLKLFIPFSSGVFFEIRKFYLLFLCIGRIFVKIGDGPLLRRRQALVLLSLILSPPDMFSGLVTPRRLPGEPLSLRTFNAPPIGGG